MNKVLITINDINDIDKLKELGIEAFVFPLKDFCVGIPNTFSVEEISKLNINSYLLLNRILDNDSIDKFKKIINKLDNIKGIIFDDLGLIPIIKDLNIVKILYLSHFNSNIESIKIYLDYVDSVFISTDIKESEIAYITKNIPNKLTLFVLGYIKAMYSRRLLIDNYAKFHHIKKDNPIIIDNTNHQFLVYENEYGTILYHKPIFNGLSLMQYPCKYYFINSTFLSLDDIIKLINNNSNLDSDRAFLDKETIYKLKGDNND